MAYIKTIWVNEETPLNEDNMNHIENGIEANYIAIQSLQQQVEHEKTKLVIDSAIEIQEQLTNLFNQFINDQDEVTIYYINDFNKHKCLFSLEDGNPDIYYISNTTLVKVNLNNIDANHYLIIIYEG